MQLLNTSEARTILPAWFDGSLRALSSARMVKTWVEAGRVYDGADLGQDSPGSHLGVM